MWTSPSSAGAISGLADGLAGWRSDPAALAAMRAASARAGRPHAASDIADLLAEVAHDALGWTKPAALTLSHRRRDALIGPDPVAASVSGHDR